MKRKRKRKRKPVLAWDDRPWGVIAFVVVIMSLILSTFLSLVPVLSTVMAVVLLVEMAIGGVYILWIFVQIVHAHQPPALLRQQQRDWR